jgi:lysine 6-dehydrogenase
MSRTTGYTATAAANMLLDGLFQEDGVFPPELVGRREVCFNYIMKYLNDRGVVYRKESVLK